MNGVNKAIVYGLLGVPLVIGTYIPLEAQVQTGKPTAQVQKLSLEDKLQVVFNSVRSRLSKNELKTNEYIRFVFEQLKSQGIVSGNFADYSDEPSFSIRIGNKLQEKLSVRDLNGLMNDYVAAENISENAKRDIQSWETLQISTNQYLQMKIGSKQVSEERFESLIRDYVSAKVPKDFDIDRMKHVINILSVNYAKKFNVIPEKNSRGEFEEDIDKAIERIKVK